MPKFRKLVEKYLRVCGNYSADLEGVKYYPDEPARMSDENLSAE